jgi:septation ring formation regulator EzrA
MKISKWKIVQLIILLLIVLVAVGYIQGKNIYNQKVAELETAKNTFGN